MDINQLSRMIEWLDEERRRDKAKIAKLEEQLLQQREYTDSMTKRMNSLESELAAARAAFIPIGRDNEIIEYMRAEIHQQMEVLEAKRISAEREAERRAENAREVLSRPIRELGERLDRFDRIGDELAAFRVERDRLANAIAALTQRMEDVTKMFDEPERRLAFLEEQRRQDARRLSEIQTELPEMQKHVDSLRPKLDLLESLALRNEKLILDIQAADRERREQAQQFIEQQTLLAQQRDSRVEELSRSFIAYDEEMRRRIERFETWAEAYRQMKKIIEDFERIGERLERRISEVAEMQRLSEERFRQEWNAWLADDQRRFRQFTLANDEAWRTNNKEFETFRSKVGEAIALFTPIQDSLERLWKLQRAQAELFRERLGALLTEHDPNAATNNPRATANGIRVSQTMRAVSDSNSGS
ncbi:hypothetical protein FBQ95_01720 [Chloroflexi bacterium CFX3]|nr:hypothetical protein [Chloroflexi bacterium CFX3]